MFHRVSGAEMQVCMTDVRHVLTWVDSGLPPSKSTGSADPYVVFFGSFLENKYREQRTRPQLRVCHTQPSPNPYRLSILFGAMRPRPLASGFPPNMHGCLRSQLCNASLTVCTLRTVLCLLCDAVVKCSVVMRCVCACTCCCITHCCGG